MEGRSLYDETSDLWGGANSCHGGRRHIACRRSPQLLGRSRGLASLETALEGHGMCEYIYRWLYGKYLESVGLGERSFFWADRLVGRPMFARHAARLASWGHRQ